MVYPYSARRGVAVAALTVLALTQAAALAQSIQWKSGPAAREIQPHEVSAEQVNAKVQALAQRPGTRRAIVHFARPLSADERARLSHLGLSILSPVSGGTYFVALGANVADAGQLAQAGAAIIDAEAIDPARKLHNSFTKPAAESPAWSIVRDAEGTGVAGDKVVGAYVMFHRDADLNAGAALVEGMGGEVRDWLLSINGLVVELPHSRLADLAGADSVLWVEPPIPMMSTLNAENRTVTQVNTVQAAPYSLDGSGVTVMVYDGGTARDTHGDFGGRLTKRDNATQITHATHVSGTIGGNGAASGGANRGMAPGVVLQSYGLQNTAGGIFLYTNPGDLEQDYTQAINTFNCDIANNSIGTNTAPNGFPCEIEGDYGITDVLIDSIVGGSLGEPFRIVWAAGNERQGAQRCGGSYRTTAPPSNNKNSIVVGSIDSDTLGTSSFTSWGPSDDGRLKPDICAPGCQAGGDGGVTSTSNGGDSNYSVLCGTSMASPTACGIGALVIEDYRTLYPGQPDMLPSTLKALFIHTVQDLGNPGPDYQYGYGNVQAQAAIDFMRTRNLFEGAVDQGGVTTAFVNAVAGQSLKITLAWDDAPGVPLVIPSLVNDLDLVVTAPGGQRFYPWTLDPANPANNAVRTAEDHLNNVEQVQVDFPMTGQYRIEVRGFSVPQGPQRFSLVGGPSLTAFSLSLASPVPGRIPPGVATTIDVRANALNQAVVAGSAQFNYRLRTTDPFTQVPLSDLGGGLFRGTLPAAQCGDEPQFFFAAAGTVTGGATAPGGAPASTFNIEVAVVEVLAQDDAEAGPGVWTLGVPGDTATTGIWTWGDPIATSAQPENDRTADPGVNCYFTGQGPPGGGAGDNDVDGGRTTLISPAFDLAGAADATFAYWRWYSNSAGGGPNADIFVIDISNDDGASWINLETIGPSGPGTSGGWIENSFQLASVIAPTAQIRLRFIAEDINTGSLIEAAVDDLRVTAVVCEQTPACPGDVDGDGMVGLGDIAGVINCWGQPGVGPCTSADLDSMGDVGLPDLAVVINNWGAVCN